VSDDLRSVEVEVKASGENQVSVRQFGPCRSNGRIAGLAVLLNVGMSLDGSFHVGSPFPRRLRMVDKTKCRKKIDANREISSKHILKSDKIENARHYRSEGRV
jgi:hypothetical protein